MASRFSCNYTWAKNIDIGSGAVAADQYTNSVTGLLWFCESCRRSLADTDVRNNITVDYLWNIPTAQSFAAPLKGGPWATGAGRHGYPDHRKWQAVHGELLMSGDPLECI